MANQIKSSSTAEYFAKNLQQVGFSSPLKAVLTTLKEAVDNSLDACEEHNILPELSIEINKKGKGASRASDLVQIIVEDNGPGLEPDMVGKVFGEYLASSKFGKGQCSRGQQGIGISAATTWAQLTNASGVLVTTKTKRMRKALRAQIDVDIKNNKGVIKNKENIDWDKEHGVRCEFVIDGRIQLNGDGGILTYLEGTTLVNPHLTIKYKLLDADWVVIPRVTDEVPLIPKPTLPHPHTMKLGEFMTHAHIYGKVSLDKFLKKGFSRVTDSSLKDFVKRGMPKAYLSKSLNKMNEKEFKNVFVAIQDTDLPNPSTKSVLTVGEEALSKSVLRIGVVDFFSVVTRKPKICDYKPIVVEVAVARFLDRGAAAEDKPIQLLRFANRVPLQFDKAGCAITKAVESINWRSYGLQQSKTSLPIGPYIIAVAVTSPFIKFKNASKETIDASDELVEELRRALMQAGQKLGRHIKREEKAADLERKLAHIEKFGPILVNGLAKIVGAGEQRKKRAEQGLKKLLGRDTSAAEVDLANAEDRLLKQQEFQRQKLGFDARQLIEESGLSEEVEGTQNLEVKNVSTKKTSKKAQISTKSAAVKKTKTTKKAVKKTSEKKKSKAQASKAKTKAKTKKSARSKK